MIQNSVKMSKNAIFFPKTGRKLVAPYRNLDSHPYKLWFNLLKIQIKIKKGCHYTTWDLTMQKSDQEGMIDGSKR